jgi:alanyl-tRNA synthetase
MTALGLAKELEQSGELVSRQVIRDSFYWYETYGIPLDIQMDVARNMGAVIDLPMFIYDAWKANWSPTKPFSVVESALCMNMASDKARAAMEIIKFSFFRYLEEHPIGTTPNKAD